MRSSILQVTLDPNFTFVVGSTGTSDRSAFTTGAMMDFDGTTKIPTLTSGAVHQTVYPRD